MVPGSARSSVEVADAVVVEPGVVCGCSVEAGEVVDARRVSRSPGVEVSGVEEEALGCVFSGAGFASVAVVGTEIAVPA